MAGAFGLSLPKPPEIRTWAQGFVAQGFRGMPECDVRRLWVLIAAEVITSLVIALHPKKLLIILISLLIRKTQALSGLGLWDQGLVVI